MFLLGVVPPLLQEGDVLTAVVEGCGQQLLQALLHLRWFQQPEQFNATAADPLRAGLLGLISRAPVMHGHGGAHGQIADAQIHNASPGAPQLPHDGIGQTIHQHALARQAHHEKSPGTIAAGHHFTDAVGQHLIADLLVVPLLQPGRCDFHGLLEGGLLIRHGPVQFLP